MRLRDLSERNVLDAIEAFYKQCNAHAAAVARTVSNASYGLPRTPRRLGYSEFPYFYAVDLYELFDYARGRRQMSSSYVDEKCEALMGLMTATIGGWTATVDWETFVETPIGLCILACGARRALRRDGGTLTVAEIAVLSGMSAEQMARAGLQPTSDEGDPVFDVDPVRALFQDRGIPI